MHGAFGYVQMNCQYVAPANIVESANSLRNDIVPFNVRKTLSVTLSTAPTTLLNSPELWLTADVVSLSAVLALSTQSSLLTVTGFCNVVVMKSNLLTMAIVRFIIITNTKISYILICFASLLL